MDEDELKKEFEYLQHEFPLVTMVTLTKYRGMIRCERGIVKELADKGVWPFTEYVRWHRFELELDAAHPFKPPKVTWLTEIPHPNIVPGEKGMVCLSLLGREWTPKTKLAAVINGLAFLLSDPNPDSTYPNAVCIQAAEVCKKYGFPKYRVAKRNSAGAAPEPVASFQPPAELAAAPHSVTPETRVLKCPRCGGMFKVVRAYAIQRTMCPYCRTPGIVK